MPTAKAVAKKLRLTPLVCYCTLGRIIPKTFSLRLATAQIGFINPTDMDRCKKES